MEVKRAKREKLKASVALMGASGSGKTLTGILIAKGFIMAKYPKLDAKSEKFWDKIGVIDVEHKRALLYANTTRADEYIGEFLHLDFAAPFSTERYREAVMDMKRSGAEVIVLDSLSHAWEGTGGILDEQQRLGGRFQDWRTINPKIKDFYKTLTEMDIHVISTIRTKQEYLAEATETGKMNITKMGTKPIQKDDIEYEMQVSWMLDMKHIATAVKDNSGMFDDMPKRLGIEDGKALYQWLEAGEDMTAKREAERLTLLEKYDTIIEINNVILNDYADNLIKGANKKYGYGLDIKKFPPDAIRSTIEALLTKAAASKIEVVI